MLRRSHLFMKIGYARVSTEDQKPELQIDALERAGCERIFVDKVSGAKFERPELNHARDISQIWGYDRCMEARPIGKVAQGPNLVGKSF